MKAITFNGLLFARTIFIFLILTTIWTILCKATDHFTDRDKGLVTGLGFLVLFAIALFTCQKMKSLLALIKLIVLTIALFLFSSFVLAPLIGIAGDSPAVYVIINCFLLAIVFTTLLHKMAGIAFRKATIALTILFLLLAYLIDAGLSKLLESEFDFDPILTMFNVFQLFLIIPLTLGMTIERKIAPQSNTDHQNL